MWLPPSDLTAQTGPTPEPWMQLGVSGLIVGFAVWVVLLSGLGARAPARDDTLGRCVR